MKKEKLRLKILGYSYGEIHDRGSWSGTNLHFYRALIKRFDVVGIIDGMRCVPGRLSRAFVTKYARLNFPISLSPVFPNSLKIKNEEMALKKKIKKIREPYNLMMHLNNVPFRKHDVPYALYIDSILQHPFAYRNASAIFTFSERLRKFLIQIYKIDPQRIITVGAGPNLFRLPKVNKLHNDKIILFIGCEAARKGGIIVLRAFEKVKEKVPDAKLIMISDELSKVCDDQQVKKFKDVNIFIKGFRTKRILGYWYRRSNVFVMPSLREPFGVAFLEAMAYKLPCIGTTKYAMPEIIEDGKTGFVVRPKSATELSDKLIFLLQHPRIAQKMGARGYERVVNYYNWDKVVDRMLPGFNKILGKK